MTTNNLIDTIVELLTRKTVHQYKAPHANRGTPAKKHYSRKHWDIINYSLFKGHRP